VGRVAVIGGGASGMMAAVTAARLGAKVTVYEKNDRVGKKILVTGNGKCNFSNRDFSERHYYGDRKKLKVFFDRFSVEDAVDFFIRAGMLVKDKGGYLYPWPEQASAVLEILRMEMRRSGVKTELCADVKRIGNEKGNGLWTVYFGTEKAEHDAVILACGGCAAPKTGSNGDGFALARKLGHRIRPVVPALVQLRCKDHFLKITAGVRCQAKIGLYEEKKGGIRELLQEEEGEVQFTDYGISGIPVFQLSRQAAYLIEEGKAAAVSIDLLPQMDRQEFEEMCGQRMENAYDRTLEEFLLGLANKKINLMMIKEAGHKPADEAGRLGEKRLKKLLYGYKELWVHIDAANSFDHAQVTAGGVELDEVTQNLESEKRPGIFFAGEILDVDGRCGGYNLQWAWTSGYIAGKSAAQRCPKQGGKTEKKNGRQRE
jgi:predicted Rossmann fold flavoprotein